MLAFVGCLVACCGCSMCGVDFLIKQNYSEGACFIVFGIGYVLLGLALRS